MNSDNKPSLIPFLVRSLVPMCLLSSALAENLPTAEEVVVTATRIATPLSQVGSSVTVITADEIRRRQYRSLAQALRMVPGVDVVQSGGPGQQTSVFMRGASSSHTLVLMDGINISDPSSPNGAVDFSSLMLDNVERIEIVRGPQSTLYGANAIGGVINIITRKGKGPTRATLTMQLGNNTSNRQQAAVRGSKDRFDYSLGGTHYKTHANSVTPADLRNGIAAEADHYRNNSLSTRLGYHFSDDLGFEFFGRYIDAKAQTDPEVGFGTIEDPDARVKDREYFLRGSGDAVLLDGVWNANLSVAYTDYSRRNDNEQQSPFETLQKTQFNGDTLEISTKNDFYLVEDHVLTLGAGTKKENMDNSGFSIFGGAFRIDELSKADARTNYAYAQDQFSFGERLFGTAGLRVDDRDDFGSELTYRITGTYQLQETGTRLNGSVGTGFRAPSLFELHGFSPNNFGTAYRGNPDLDAEKSFGWELGFDQSLLSRRLEVGATYFKNDIKNLIETVFDPLFNSTSDNINKVHIDGVETFVSARLHRTLSARVDYTFTDIDSSDDSDRPLLRRPRKKASATLNYQPLEPVDLYLGVDYVGKRKDVDRLTGSTIKAQDYTVFNTSLSWQLHRQFSLDLRVDNLLDKHYEPADGFEAVGRQYMAGFTATM